MLGQRQEGIEPKLGTASPPSRSYQIARQIAETGLVGKRSQTRETRLQRPGTCARNKRRRDGMWHDSKSFPGATCPKGGRTAQASGDPGTSKTACAEFAQNGSPRDIGRPPHLTSVIVVHLNPPETWKHSGALANIKQLFRPGIDRKSAQGRPFDNFSQERT